MKGFSTKVIHSRPQKEDVHGALRVPVYSSAAFEFESAEAIADAFQGKIRRHSYSRVTNPTVEYFEQQVRDATGASAVLAVSSGMAAISNTILGLCGRGENIVASSYLFGNTYASFNNTYAQWGIEAHFADFSDLSSVEEKIDNKTRAL
ncbi:MAG: PLP-dependent transferase, partial [Spirochaetales bacterium]|nr:PLP-dependent transferase [Spirochaetales bacterium]